MTKNEKSMKVLKIYLESTKKALKSYQLNKLKLKFLIQNNKTILYKT